MLFEEEVFQNGFELGCFATAWAPAANCPSLLEYFDAQGITKRKGDVRTLGRRP